MVALSSNTGGALPEDITRVVDLSSNTGGALPEDIPRVVDLSSNTGGALPEDITRVVALSSNHKHAGSTKSQIFYICAVYTCTNMCNCM